MLAQLVKSRLIFRLPERKQYSGNLQPLISNYLTQIISARCALRSLIGEISLEIFQIRESPDMQRLFLLKQKRARTL